MPQTLHILPWDRPLLDRAVEHFTTGWAGGALDLADRLIVVPTRQAGRRLRAALALQAAERGGAVFAPRVVVPEQLLEVAAPGQAIASKAQTTLAWVQTLQQEPLAELRAVFPVDPPDRGFAWALRLAGEMMRLQAALVEGGLRFADVAARAGDGFVERGRWQQLARLEAAVDAWLAARGVLALQAAAVAAVGRAALPEGISRVSVLAVVDPLPLVLRVLEKWSETLPVEVLVFGPEAAEGRIVGRSLLAGDAAVDSPASRLLQGDAVSEPSLFDEWGRPRAEVWAERRLELEPFAQRVHLCADPAAQAAKIAGRLAEARSGIAALASSATAVRRGDVRENVEKGVSPLDLPALAGRATGLAGRVGIGSADPEVLPLVAAELRGAGVECHLPEGRALSRSALAGLIDALRVAVREDDWASAAALARRTEVSGWLGAECGCAPDRLWAALDVLQGDHLPPTLAEARRHTEGLETRYPGIGAALARLAGLLGELRDGGFPQTWDAVLGRLYAERDLDPARAEDRVLMEAVDAWREAAAEVAAAGGGAVTVGEAGARRFPSPEQGRALRAEDACGLALQLFGAGRLFDDKAPGAVELDGWLELVFRDEPELLVAGLNEGCAPEAVVGHAFLPESLREQLGLKTNAQRFARDAWQLAALAACRAEGGRLEVFLGKASAGGDPLKPSRLLFRCDEAGLPSRVQLLFRELEPVGGNVAWRRAWRWRVPWRGAPSRLRVTGFRDYLACPFRFYLKHVLKMEPVDAAKRELDARDFGTLVHGVLERLGQDVAWRDCTDAELLGREFDAALEAVVAARFGAELSVPLLVQVESARQRLREVARLQAAERAAGWVVDRTEWKLPAGALRVGGIEVSGTIDRIERHERTGAWRVLDYKTSETGKTPVQAHLRGDRAGKAWLEAARVDLGGKPHRWTDLQLPLYRWALGELLDARDVTVGYFNLPKAVSETRIELWEDFGDEVQAAALDCAAAVGAGVSAGRFWPPVEELENDDFAALIHDGAAASFDVGDWPGESVGEFRGEGADRCSGEQRHGEEPKPSAGFATGERCHGEGER